LLTPCKGIAAFKWRLKSSMRGKVLAFDQGKKGILPQF